MRARAERSRSWTSYILWVFTDTRLRARALMTEALERWTKLTYRSGWNQLRSNVVRDVSASDIARVYQKISVK